jgi:hypothetical protein
VSTGRGPSSEKNDKKLPERGSAQEQIETVPSDQMPATTHRAAAESPQRGPAAVVQLQERRRAIEEVLRCVSSGYMADGCSCTRTVPASAAVAGWSAEQARGGGGSRFFHFAWKGEMWLGFGLEDGSVRGIYCPPHRAEREARSCGCEAQHYAPVAAGGA